LRRGALFDWDDDDDEDLQWKSWTGNELVPHGTAFEGQFYPGRFKNRSSQAPIGVPK